MSLQREAGAVWMTVQEKRRGKSLDITGSRWANLPSESTQLSVISTSLPILPYSCEWESEVGELCLWKKTGDVGVEGWALGG